MNQNKQAPRRRMTRREWRIRRCLRLARNWAVFLAACGAAVALMTSGILWLLPKAHALIAGPEAFVARNYDGTEYQLNLADARLVLVATDENGISVTVRSDETFEVATNPAQVERVVGQLRKSGDTEYDCYEVEYHDEMVLFIPSSVVNGYRRQLLDALSREREDQRERWVQEPLNQDVKYTGSADWRLNVVNRLATEFYREHGVETVEPGFETGNKVRGREVMTTRYCLLFELSMCRKTGKDKALKFPLYLSNNLGRFRLEFDCKHCFMKVLSI